MMKVGAFIACAMIAASAVISGTALARSDLDQLTKTQIRNVDRPIEISLTQIEYCLGRDAKKGQTALNVIFDDKCPIDQVRI